MCRSLDFEKKLVDAYKTCMRVIGEAVSRKKYLRVIQLFSNMTFMTLNICCKHSSISPIPTKLSIEAAVDKNLVWDSNP